MMYELAHLLKNKCKFLWEMAEWGNAAAFAVLYRKKMKTIGRVLQEGAQAPYTLKLADKNDVPQLLYFFRQQPPEAFHFFNPHDFDEKSLRKVIGNPSFLAFVLIDQSGMEEELVGYAFMRSFANGAAYRGYMVDAAHRGKGLAKMMGLGLNRVGDALGLKMYKSISPENVASMKVTQAVCDIEILKTLENGDYLIRCMSKPSTYMRDTVIGGGKIYVLQVTNPAVMPHNHWRYAA